MKKGIFFVLIALVILFLFSFASSYIIYTKTKDYTDETNQIMVTESRTEEQRAVQADNNLNNQNRIYEEETESTTSLPVENENVFCAREYEGYVAIFNYTNSLYEYTDISIDSLDAEMKKKIKEGIYFENIEELFAFLESYSS